MATQTVDKQSGGKSDALTLDKARQIFTVAAMRDDSEHTLIREYYHPDVRFRDAIQEVRGREEFIAMTERFVKRFKDLDVRVHEAAQSNDTIFIEWTMSVSLGRGPATAFEGTSKLKLDAHGKVIEHRDYFDLWGDTLGSLPVLGKAYRKLIKKLG